MGKGFWEGEFGKIAMENRHWKWVNVLHEWKGSSWDDKECYVILFSCSFISMELNRKTELIITKAKA